MNVFVIKRKIPLWLLCFSLITLIAGCEKDPPREHADWSVSLSDNDAFTLAAVILGQARISGCGNFEVTTQQPASHQVTVICDPDGTKTQHTLEYWPLFKADSREVEKSAWKATWLGTAYCVKNPDGKWDKAFIDIKNALNRGITLSTETGKPVRFYSSENLLYWESEKKSDGSWSYFIAKAEVKYRDERRGCELEKGPLKRKE